MCRCLGVLLLLSLFSLSPLSARAQVIDLGDSFFTSATANTPGCSDSDGGAGITDAAAACSNAGYVAAGSAQATVIASTSGAELFVFAEAEAGSVGPPANNSATGAGNVSAVNSWNILSSTHYSVSITATGGATASFNDGTNNLPPSGVLPPDTYALNASANALAIAQDSGGAQFVTAGPRQASARVTFAAVGSPTLVMGTVLAGGAGAPGLLVEALDGGQIVVASTLTGNDGSYLLPDLPGAVTLRVSDPEGAFETQTSGALTPPDTFDTDLDPVAVPGLAPPVALAAVALLAAAAHRRWTRA